MNKIRVFAGLIFLLLLTFLSPAMAAQPGYIPAPSLGSTAANGSVDITTFGVSATTPTADQSVGIQFAMNNAVITGKVLTVPLGTFVSQNVQIPPTLHMSGSGPGTIFQLPPAASLNHFYSDWSCIMGTNITAPGGVAPTNIVSASNITLENMSFWGTCDDLVNYKPFPATNTFEHTMMLCFNGINNSVLRNIWIYKFNGDGIYFAGSYAASGNSIYQVHNQNIFMENLWIDGYNWNNRNGMSIEDMDGFTGKNLWFMNDSQPGEPTGMIDFEPNNTAWTVLKNIDIDGYHGRMVGAGAGCINLKIQANNPPPTNIKFRNVDIDGVLWGGSVFNFNYGLASDPTDGVVGESLSNDILVDTFRVSNTSLWNYYGADSPHPFTFNGSPITAEGMKGVRITRGEFIDIGGSPSLIGYSAAGTKAIDVEVNDVKFKRVGMSQAQEAFMWGNVSKFRVLKSTFTDCGKNTNIATIVVPFATINGSTTIVPNYSNINNGDAVTGAGIPSLTTVTTINNAITSSNATTTNNSTTLTLGTANASILPGMTIYGPNMATRGATVVSNSGTTVVMSGAAKGAGTSDYIFAQGSAVLSNPATADSPFTTLSFGSTPIKILCQVVKNSSTVNFIMPAGLIGGMAMTGTGIPSSTTLGSLYSTSTYNILSGKSSTATSTGVNITFAAPTAYGYIFGAYGGTASDNIVINDDIFESPTGFTASGLFTISSTHSQSPATAQFSRNTNKLTANPITGQLKVYRTDTAYMTSFDSQATPASFPNGVSVSNQTVAEGAQISTIINNGSNIIIPSTLAGIGSVGSPVVGTGIPGWNGTTWPTITSIGTQTIENCVLTSGQTGIIPQGTAGKILNQPVSGADIPANTVISAINVNLIGVKQITTAASGSTTLTPTALDNILPGSLATNSNIPANTYVTAVNTGSGTVTISQPTTGAISAASVYFGPAATNSAGGNITTSTNTIILSQGVAGLSTGMRVYSGSGWGTGTATITNITGNVVTLSANSSSTYATSPMCFGWQCSTTNASTAVTLAAPNTNLAVGQAVYGAYIPAGATIASITDSTHFTLDSGHAATSTQANTWAAFGQNIFLNQAPTATNTAEALTFPACITLSQAATASNAAATLTYSRLPASLGSLTGMWKVEKYSDQTGDITKCWQYFYPDSTDPGKMIFRKATSGTTWGPWYTLTSSLTSMADEQEELQKAA
ncbi:MAG: hypothetical protein P4N59_25255 [Negativicutes bacterium]|nr:hypothetical protein [Negativicutes bacterium]